MRHPSPKTLASFGVNNVSQSNVAEDVGPRTHAVKKLVVAPHKKINFKRASECSMYPTTKPPSESGRETEKSAVVQPLDESSKRPPSHPRPMSQAGLIKDPARAKAIHLAHALGPDLLGRLSSPPAGKIGFQQEKKVQDTYKSAATCRAVVKQGQTKQEVPTSSKCTLKPKAVDLCYKELMAKAKKTPSESLALSLWQKKTQQVDSSPTTPCITHPNKLDKARDSLVHWIIECETYISSTFVDKKKHKAHPESSLEFYVVGKVLGKGAFGKVNLCVHKLTGKLVAIKSLHKHFLESEQNNKKFQNEIALLEQLHHKNVIRLYETFSADNYFLIVIELCSGGDLLTYVRKRRKLTEPVAKATFKQVPKSVHPRSSTGSATATPKASSIATLNSTTSC
jgi:hypothetical protein